MVVNPRRGVNVIDKLRPPALTVRGRRTRAALIEAARRVFSQSGYVDGSVVAITQEAGVSNATFYPYFRSKEEIFLDVAAGLIHDIAISTEDLVEHASLAAGIAAANASFIDTYTVHGRMLRVVAEAADHNDTIRSELERTLNHVWLSTLTSPVTVPAPRRRGGRRSRVSA
jgi:AcrR family transcriptional regulator